MLMLSDCATNVHRSKQRKYISLNRSHQQFDQIYKGYHQCAYDADRIRLKDKTKGDET